MPLNEEFTPEKDKGKALKSSYHPFKVNSLEQRFGQMGNFYSLCYIFSVDKKRTLISETVNPILFMKNVLKINSKSSKAVI